MSEKERWLSVVREALPEKRYIHTIGVMETAVRLAEQYGCDVEKAELAAILHDYAKYWSGEKMAALIRQDERSKAVLNHSRSLWHAYAGALAAEREFGVRDPDVLDAIRYHTSGRAGMSLLEKVIWLADYIEPGRSFPGVDDVRKKAEESLDEAMILALGRTIRFLIENKQPVYPLTFEAYNDLVTSSHS